MNERILELAEQAKDHARKYVADCNHYGYYMEHNEYDIRFAEKFAELIVKECVEVCAGIAAVRAGYNDADGRDTAYSCGDMIKEHFGVEE